MSLFYSRRPRGFHHEFMFADTRKERLAAIKEKAEKELKAGVDAGMGQRLERGVFLNATRYASRHKSKRPSTGRLFASAVAVMLVLLLVFIWKMLLSF